MLHIVLFEPEIPENTGNIARICVGFNAVLHLIKPCGFFLNNKKMIRSGVDYWDKLTLHEHDSYDDFLKTVKNKKNIFYLTRYGVKRPDEVLVNTKKDIYFMFGKESTGIEKNIILENKANTVRIPCSKNIRSMNLSNCVGIMAYQYVIQSNFDGLELKEVHKKIF